MIEQVKKDKNLEVDIVIATPDCMKLLGQLGRILGTKNLMPNPKEGTVTKNVKNAVENAKKGQIRYLIYSNQPMKFQYLRFQEITGWYGILILKSSCAMMM